MNGRGSFFVMNIQIFGKMYMEIILMHENFSRTIIFKLIMNSTYGDDSFKIKLQKQ